MGYETYKRDILKCGCYTEVREHDFFSGSDYTQILCKQHQEEKNIKDEKRRIEWEKGREKREKEQEILRQKKKEEEEKIKPYQLKCDELKEIHTHAERH